MSHTGSDDRVSRSSAAPPEGRGAGSEEEHVNGTNHPVDTPDTPDSYVVEHARTALACDPRVAALDIGIVVDGRRVIASGTVETETRRAAIESVLVELLPRHELVVAVTVSRLSSAEPTAEELP
jgi:hypothetical protein